MYPYRTVTFASSRTRCRLSAVLHPTLFLSHRLAYFFPFSLFTLSPSSSSLLLHLFFDSLSIIFFAFVFASVGIALVSWQSIAVFFLHDIASLTVSVSRFGPLFSRDSAPNCDIIRILSVGLKKKEEKKKKVRIRKIRPRYGKCYRCGPVS